MLRRFSDAERLRILREWTRSGLSSHDFAAARGVSHATLHRWKRELGGEGSLSRRRFVEIVPTASAGVDQGASGARTDSGLELLIGRGHRITIARDFAPLSEHPFLFTSRRADRLKILWWDRDGSVIWCKRLERGSFRVPADLHARRDA